MWMHSLSFTSLPIHTSSGSLSPRKPPVPEQLQDGPQLQHHQRPDLEQTGLQETMFLSTHPGHLSPTSLCPGGAYPSCPGGMARRGLNKAQPLKGLKTQVLMEGSGQTGERAWGQPLSAGVAREVRTSSQDGSARLPPPPKGDVSLASRGAAAG